MAKQSFWQQYRIWIILGILALLLVSVWMMYNGLVSSEVAVDNGWANVETQYQRRYDLIPNLVETVKGYATHERELFEEVTRLRSQWAGAKTAGQKMAASNQLEASLGRLLLVAENYPQLKASENFLSLQDELAGTENRIGVARTRYNTMVRDFNTRIRTFPRNIIAGMFGFEKRQFFESEGGAEKAPQVSF